MNPGSIVVVNLRHPVERILGRLIEVTTSGVTIRGLDVGAFEDWIHEIQRGENGVCPSTVFLPMHRIEKMMMDEAVGAVPSLSDTFMGRVGVSIFDHLEGK